MLQMTNIEQSRILLLICTALINKFQFLHSIKLPAHRDLVLQETVDIHLSNIIHYDVTQTYSLPHSLVVEFSTKGTPVQLNLKKNYRISSDVPVHLDKDGVPVPHIPQQIENVKYPDAYYQDMGTGASFHIECLAMMNLTCRKYELFGTFPLNGALHIIESLPDSSSDEQQMKYNILKANQTTGHWIDSIHTDDLSQPSPVHRQRRSRSKRAAELYTVELYLVMDYSIYKYWYNGYNGSTTPSQTKDYAISRIKTFAGFHINGIDTRFRSINSYKFKISVKYAGIYIAKTQSSSSWTEDARTTGDTADAGVVLNKFVNWVDTNSDKLPKRDHAMLFTRYDLTKDGKSSNRGFAYTGAICKKNGQSVVEDTFNFIVETAAAHELGHSLGAEHDGVGSNTCSANDYYVMTPSLSARDGANALHPWNFSSCSIDEIESTLNLLDQSKTNCLKTKDSALDLADLQKYMSTEIGQIYDINDQCQINYGDNSYACLTLYPNGYDKICSGLWCSLDNNKKQCSLMIPADGTICGEEKWCKQGRCVYSVDAPFPDSECLYGDSLGEKVNGLTCSAMKSKYPWYCYSLATRLTCCETCDSLHNNHLPDCEYGDRTDCSSLTSGASCYTGDNSKLCCDTCGSYKSGIPGCPYGDRTSGCVSSLCTFYTPKALNDCCGTCYKGTTTPDPSGKTSESPPGGSTTISPSTTTKGSKSSSSLVIPIGAAAGGLVFIVILVVVVCYCIRKSPGDNEKTVTNNMGMVNQAYNLSSEETAYRYNYISSKNVQGPRASRQLTNGKQSPQENLPPRPLHPPPRPNHPPSRSASIDDSHIYVEIADVQNYYSSLQTTPNGESSEYTQLPASK